MRINNSKTYTYTSSKIIFIFTIFLVSFCLLPINTFATTSINGTVANNDFFDDASFGSDYNLEFVNQFSGQTVGMSDLANNATIESWQYDSTSLNKLSSPKVSAPTLDTSHDYGDVQNVEGLKFVGSYSLTRKRDYSKTSRSYSSRGYSYVHYYDFGNSLYVDYPAAVRDVSTGDIYDCRMYITKAMINIYPKLTVAYANFDSDLVSIIDGKTKTVTKTWDIFVGLTGTGSATVSSSNTDPFYNNLGLYIDLNTNITDSGDYTEKIVRRVSFDVSYILYDSNGNAVNSPIQGIVKIDDLDYKQYASVENIRQTLPTMNNLTEQQAANVLANNVFVNDSASSNTSKFTLSYDGADSFKMASLKSESYSQDTGDYYLVADDVSQVDVKYGYDILDSSGSYDTSFSGITVCAGAKYVSKVRQVVNNQTYRISTSVDNGTITPQIEGIVAGTQEVIDYSSNTNLKKIEIDGTEITASQIEAAGNSYAIGTDIIVTNTRTTFNNINSNHNIIVTYYGQSYNISYNLDGGTLPNNYPSTYIAGEETSLVPATKTGYTFAGWYSDEGLNSKVDIIDTTMTGDLTLYAKYNSNKTYDFLVNANSSTVYQNNGIDNLGLNIYQQMNFEANKNYMYCSTKPDYISYIPNDSTINSMSSANKETILNRLNTLTITCPPGLNCDFNNFYTMVDTVENLDISNNKLYFKNNELPSSYTNNDFADFSISNKTLTITYKPIQNVDNLEYAICFDVSINDNSVVASSGNVIQTSTEYIKDFYGDTSNINNMFETTNNTVTAYTYGLKIDDLDNSIQEAKFAIYASYNESTDTYSNQLGSDIEMNNLEEVFKGLDSTKTYYLKEIYAPSGHELYNDKVIALAPSNSGYNLDKYAVYTINQDGYYVVGLSNNAIRELPHTGNSYTIYHILLGVLIIFISSIILIAYYKKKNKLEVI